MPGKKHRFILDPCFSWKDTFPRTRKKAVIYSLKDVDLPLSADDYQILDAGQRLGSIVLTGDSGSGYNPREVFKPDYTHTGVVQLPQDYDQEEQDEAVYSLVTMVPFAELFQGRARLRRGFVTIVRKGGYEETWTFEE